MPVGANARTVASVAPDAAYHIGCPISAMVATEDTEGPTPVEIAKLEPKGGVSDKLHEIGDANMKDHKKDKANKHKTLYPPQL